VKVSFRSGKLEKLCNSQKAMRRFFGEEVSRKLMRRLLELAAFETLAQVPSVPPFRCHQLSGDRAGSFAVDVDEKSRIVFVCDNSPVPKLADGGLDKSQVTAICILEVTDYHG